MTRAGQTPRGPRGDPPTSEDELLARARDLCGRSAGELADLLGLTLGPSPVRTKGLVGTLVEAALGASAGTRDEPDFPDLGVELKTIPLSLDGRARESTFVCTLDLHEVDREEWGKSRVLRKLRRVLWVPVLCAPGHPPARRRLGRACLWSPSPEEEAMLRADWEDLTGRIAVGGIEEVTAHMGRALQVRPKARSSADRVLTLTPEGLIETVPRGFYLRARFSTNLLWHCSESR